jgi:hypothetical protein
MATPSSWTLVASGTATAQTVTAHCSVSTDVPVSSLMAGSKMLTAEVLALTTRVDRQVAADTPPVRVLSLCSSEVRSTRSWINGGATRAIHQHVC